MNRKAVSMAFVMAAIVLLLLMLGLLFFVNTVFQKTKETIPEKKCQASVEREAYVNMIGKQTKAGSTAKDFASNVECQTIPIELKGSDAWGVAGMAGVFMEKCWKTFGQGKLELFSQGEGTFCHVCYALTTDAGTTIALEGALKAKPKWAVPYDVPQQLAGEKLGIIFEYKKDSVGIAQKVIVRALDSTQPLDVCAGAEFPSQRT